MNKMAKGAIATGVGIILLVGGGGTLAVWNQTSEASMGSVVAGDLNLEAVGEGVWKNANNKSITIAEYRVVPGDVLTYTQDLNVTLTGDLMTATLAVTGAGEDGAGDNAFGNAATVSHTILTKDTQILPGTVLAPGNSGVVKASTTFTFNVETASQTGADASYDFSKIGYELNQVAPVVPAP